MKQLRQLGDTLDALPPWLRHGVALLLVLAGFTLVAALPGMSTLHAQLTLFLAVAICAFRLGLAPGLSAATLGFALLLWQSFGALPASAMDSAWGHFVDALLWFAVAKLMAALIAGSHRRLRETAAAREAAEAEAQRHGLREQELSHRFNNDMQMLVGLLRSEAATDPQAADSLRRAAGRLQIVGRVHRRLLGGFDSASVNVQDFLTELASDMQATMDQLRPIAIVVDAEPHLVPARTASDVGLAANELVTNALKYAFPGTREGVVRISFSLEGSGVFVLTVADNGIGIGPDARGRQSGIGMRLLRALAAQLGGRLDVQSGEVGGTVSQLRFPAAVQAAGAPSPLPIDLDPRAPKPAEQPRSASL